MAGWIPNDKNRNVIPRWRDFKQTIQLGELNPIANQSKGNKDGFSPFFHQNKIYDWNTEKSIKHAIELLNSSIILDDQENTLKAAKFLQTSTFSTQPLKDVAKQNPVSN